MSDAAKLAHAPELEHIEWLKNYIANLRSDFAAAEQHIFENIPSLPREAELRRALEHAKVRFECLADQFEEAGDTASWAMASVDADRMTKALDQLALNEGERKPSVVTDEMITAAIDAAWPGSDVVYCDEFDSAESMMRAAIEAAMALRFPPGCEPCHETDAVEGASCDLSTLVDWVYIYATEGEAWPDHKTVSGPLIEIAKARKPTQVDADSLKSGVALKLLLNPRALPSTKSTSDGGADV